MSKRYSRSKENRLLAKSAKAAARVRGEEQPAGISELPRQPWFSLERMRQPAVREKSPRSKLTSSPFPHPTSR